LTLFIARNDPGRWPWPPGGAIFCRPAKIGAPLFVEIYGGGEIGLGAKRQDSTLGDGEGSCAAGGEIRFDTKDAKDTKHTKDAPIDASLISGAAPSTGCA
jgi:hypothetical protein